MWPVSARYGAGTAEEVWHAKAAAGVWTPALTASFVQMQGNVFRKRLLMLIKAVWK